MDPTLLDFIINISIDPSHTQIDLTVARQPTLEGKNEWVMQLLLLYIYYSMQLCTICNYYYMQLCTICNYYYMQLCNNYYVH